MRPAWSLPLAPMSPHDREDENLLSMPMQLTSLPTAFLVPIACVLAGCGSDDISRVKLVSVTGTVTHEGKPLEGAEVTFAPDVPPDSKEVATPGGDITGPAGNFKAMFRGRSGLAPGKYKVLVNKNSLPDGVQLGEGTDLEMLRAAAQSQADGARGRRSKNAPGPSLTMTRIHGEFECEVPAKGGDFTFDVKGAAEPLSGPR